jgi:hypothetical protein
MDEFRWTLEMIYIVKSFADHGKLAALTDITGDMRYEPDYYYELCLNAAGAVFADTRRYYNDKNDVETCVMYDPVIYRYNLLCRAYEARNGITEAENPYVKEMESAIRAALQMGSYSYNYDWATKTDRPEGCKLVLLTRPEFETWYEVPEGLLEIYDFYVKGAAKLEKELQKNLANVIALPAPCAEERKEAA